MGGAISRDRIFTVISCAQIFPVIASQSSFLPISPSLLIHFSSFLLISPLVDALIVRLWPASSYSFISFAYDLYILTSHFIEVTGVAEECLVSPYLPVIHKSFISRHFSSFPYFFGAQILTVMAHLRFRRPLISRPL